MIQRFVENKLVKLKFFKHEVIELHDVPTLYCVMIQYVRLEI